MEVYDICFLCRTDVSTGTARRVDGRSGEKIKKTSDEWCMESYGVSLTDYRFAIASWQRYKDISS